MKPGLLDRAAPLTTRSFRSVGITAYGFEPYKMDDGELDRAHGDDERLSVENVGFALQFLYEVLMEFELKPDGPTTGYRTGNGSDCVNPQKGQMCWG